MGKKLFTKAFNWPVAVSAVGCCYFCRVIVAGPLCVLALLSAVYMYRGSILKSYPDRIKELLTRVIELDPKNVRNNVQVHFMLAFEERESGNIKASLEHLDRAAELAPNGAKILYWRSVSRVA